jgi:hypothetical protein
VKKPTHPSASKNPLTPAERRLVALSDAGGLWPVLPLYLHAEPVNMRQFQGLADLTPEAARKALRAMQRFGIATVRIARRPGIARPLRISLTEAGADLGARLWRVAKLLDGPEAERLRKEARRRRH